MLITSAVQTLFGSEMVEDESRRNPGGGGDGADRGPGKPILGEPLDRHIADTGLRGEISSN